MESGTIPDRVDEANKAANDYQPSWQDLFVQSYDAYNGYVNTVEGALDLIARYEMATTTRFTCVNQTARFGSTEG